MKIWIGPPPSQNIPNEYAPIAFAAGYRAAMNSPEVMAMYEALTGRSWTPEQQRQTNAAIRTYEAGMEVRDMKCPKSTTVFDTEWFHQLLREARGVDKNSSPSDLSELHELAEKASAILQDRLRKKNI